MEPIDQARRYFKGVPPAISGQDGHSQAFSAMSALVHGFCLSDSDALMVFGEWNAGCQPPWSEREIAHKLSEVKKKPCDKPRGHLLSNSRSGASTTHRSSPITQHSSRHQIASPAPKAKQYGDVKMNLPKPLEDGTRKYLKALFHKGEAVRIILADLGDDGSEVPNAGATLKLEDWLKKLDSKNGDINKILKSADKCGIYVGINPLKIGKSAHDENVTDYRNVLIEFDEIPIEEQYGLILASQIPCRAIVSSGGKSVHAIVAVDAKDSREYAERADILINHFEAYKVDRKNRNPARISRLPGCERFARRQELIALNTGLSSFDEWFEFVNREDVLPKPVSAREFLSIQIAKPAEIIHGILHRGLKLGLAGGSKSYKSWTLLDLAISVAVGKPWLSFPTTKGKVMFVNFELPDFAWQERIGAVCREYDIEFQDDDLQLLNLRGHANSYEILLPHFEFVLKSGDFSLIIIDPTYKMYGPGTDENSASDMGQLMNGFERLCVSSGAALAFGSHFSKGNQSSKKAIDRTSGSGVFARDPDALLSLTELKEENTFSFEATLRVLPPIAPFGVRWKFPVMQIDSSLDATDLKKPKSSTAKEITDDDLKPILRLISGSTKENPVTSSAWAKQAGLKISNFNNNYLPKMREKRLIESVGEGTSARKYITVSGLNLIKDEDENEPF